jgi:hypothetical protein
MAVRARRVKESDVLLDSDPPPAYIRDEFQSSLMTTGFALGAGEAQEEICHDSAAYAEGDRRLAGREHRALVRTDRRFL